MYYLEKSVKRSVSDLVPWHFFRGALSSEDAVLNSAAYAHAGRELRFGSASLIRCAIDRARAAPPLQPRRALVDVATPLQRYAGISSSTAHEHDILTAT